jgi:ATP/maltotriose-dependent transcriptional regulator MalT
MLAETLLWDGDLVAARDWFEDVRADAVRSGTEVHLPYCLFDLAVLACAEGGFDTARALVHEATMAARDAQDPWAERLLLYPAALAATWLGDADAAGALAERRLAEAEAKEERPGIVRARGVLGLLALSQGDGETAARELDQAADLLEALRFEHPGAFPVLPDAVEALACAGRDDRAAELLARLERRARAVGSRWAIAAGDRAGGALLLARGDPDAAIARLERAVAALDGLGYRPDAARAVFLRGRALLRGGQRVAAADAFADARSRFSELGAALWAERVGEELERAAPGRATGALTPAERRVAGLVADGMKNREIGPALFMSVGTVEAHLTRIYRKLGIRSRSELVRMVADGDV